MGFDFGTEVDGETNLGALLKFDVTSGARTVVAETVPALKRPIGLLFKAFTSDASVPEPGMVAGLFTLGLMSLKLRRQALKS
ncbi:MAG: PEP-CTERM sorting domain-containing protein [Cyanobacteria bacterium J06626_23]